MADPLPPSPDEGDSADRPAGPRGRPSKARGQPNSSDAASARWTIRGVPPKVREMALRAADARNMTVGDWVAEAIIQTVRRGEAAATRSLSNLPATDAPPDLVKMIAGLDQRLARLEEQQQRSFVDRILAIIHRHTVPRTERDHTHEPPTQPAQ